MSFLNLIRKNCQYFALGLGVSFLALTAVVVYENWSALSLVLSGGLGFLQKVNFFISLYTSLDLHYSTLSLILLLTLVGLFGTHVALFVFYVRRLQVGTKGTKRLHATSFLGLVAGLFGVGCAACGSILISGLMSIFGASGLLLLMPFHGQEFGLLGIILLTLAIYFLAKKIRQPIVCEI